MAKKKPQSAYDVARQRLKNEARAAKVARAMNVMRYGQAEGPTPVQEAQQQLADERQKALRDAAVGAQYNRMKYGQESGPSPVQIARGMLQQERNKVRQDQEVGDAYDREKFGTSGVAALRFAGIADLLAGRAKPTSAAGATLQGIGQAPAGLANLLGNMQRGNAAGGAADAAKGTLGNIANVLQMMGPYGTAVGAGVRALTAPISAGQAALGMANGAVEQYGRYNAGTAAAMSQAQAADVMGNIRRANLLGPEMAPFVQAQSRAEQAGKDAVAEMLKPIMPLLTDVLNGLADFIKASTGEWLGLLRDFFKGLTVVTHYMNQASGDKFKEMVRAFYNTANRIDDYIKKRTAMMEGKTALDMLMEMKAPGDELRADQIENNWAGRRERFNQPGAILPAFGLP